jgi:hypothetical protein
MENGHTADRDFLFVQGVLQGAGSTGYISFTGSADEKIPLSMVHVN